MADEPVSGIVFAALALGFVVLHHTQHHPRTDDAEIFANFIGIAPQVDGPIVRLNVHDNQFVKQGDLLFEIDERPYRYALERAISEQAALEGQIADEQRRIARPSQRGFRFASQYPQLESRRNAMGSGGGSGAGRRG